MLLNDNVRKLRRYLQGAGVNIRETIVAGVDNDPNVGTRTPVPGLKDDDGLISVLDMANLVDLASELDEGTAASVSIFATTKGVKYTARRIGPDGNNIYVKYVANASGNDGSPIVTVTPYLVGKTLITVELSTTAAKNTAALVRVAVLDNVNASLIVDAALVGSGATQVTATGPHALGAAVAGDVSASVVGHLHQMGATASTLLTSLALDANGLDPNLLYTAVKKGAAGSQGDAQISVKYIDPGAPAALSVAVVATNKIEVTLGYVAAIVSTGDEIVAAIRASAAASALVTVKPARSSGALEGSAPGVAPAMAATNLAGGQDSGIVLAGDHSYLGAIKVSWVTRGNAS